MAASFLASLKPVGPFTTGSITLSLLKAFVGVAPALRTPFSTSQVNDQFYLKRSYLKRWGRRDIKRRQLVADHELARTNLRMLKKADFLPYGVKMKAAEDIQQLPRDSSPIRIRNRCTLTDRPRGLVGRYRISRMEFREFGEKALIAGVQKSCW